MVLMLSETAKITFALWLFVRGFVKAVVEYFSRESKLNNEPLNGKGVGKEFDLPEKLPSIIDIKKALPKRCFQPTVATSMYYVLMDLTLVAITYGAICVLHQIPSTPVYLASLLMYWALQGTFFTSIFVLGHDCGHGSFSDHTLLNDVVGTLLHSFILCPYYAWKVTHRHHHKHNADFDNDEVFYPVKKSEPSAKGKVLPGFGFGIGWWGYLVLGYNPRPVNHFNPTHSMFAGHLLGVTLSYSVFFTMVYGLYRYTLAYGLWAMVSYYLIPVFIFAGYMVVITFLHHNEVNVPWFAADNWEFVRGQLSTIDRHYGPVHHIIHNIGTHQMHHMFTKIPHYHLEEATRHFRQAFPELVRLCDEPILPSFMRMFKKYEKHAIIEDDCQKHVYL